MAENKIGIIVEAIDNVTDRLAKVEKAIKNFQKTTEKESEKVSSAFQKQTDSLLAVGNAANAVDRIMSSYQNLQLRLENATERVTGAQDRLADAQYNLRKVQSDTSSTADDLAHSQGQVESATRSLTIAQNNLERANNQVLGTYINMGIQTVSLVQSLPKVLAAVQSLTTASWAFAATPIGAVLAAVALLAGGVYFVMHNVAGAQEEVNAAFSEASGSIQAAKNAFGQLLPLLTDVATTLSPVIIAALNVAVDVFNGLMSVLQTVTLGISIFLQELKVAGEFLSDVFAYGIETATSNLQFNLDVLQQNIATEWEKIGADKEQAKSVAETIPPIQAQTNAITEQDIAIQNLTKDLELSAKAAEKAFGKGHLSVKQFEGLARGESSSSVFAEQNARADVALGKSQAHQARIREGRETETGSFNDFISRPGQGVSTFSPDDTIIGVKDPSSLMGGGGVNVNIQMNSVSPNYDARALASAIKRELAVS